MRTLIAISLAFVVGCTNGEDFRQRRLDISKRENAVDKLIASAVERETKDLNDRVKRAEDRLSALQASQDMLPRRTTYYYPVVDQCDGKTVFKVRVAEHQTRRDGSRFEYFTDSGTFPTQDEALDYCRAKNAELDRKLK